MVKKIGIFLLSFNVCALEIREPQREEIPAIAAAYYESAHATYDTLAPYLISYITHEYCLDRWNRYFQTTQTADNYFILLAIQDSRIVGMVYAGAIEKELREKYRDYTGQIHKLYVLPSMNNQGIGSQLLRAGLSRLKSMGFKKVIIASLANNAEANRFYENTGGILLDQLLLGRFNEQTNIYRFDLL